MSETFWTDDKPGLFKDQMLAIFSFEQTVENITMMNMRGFAKDVEEAKRKIKVLSKTDTEHQIYAVPVGKWFRLRKEESEEKCEDEMEQDFKDELKKKHLETEERKKMRKEKSQKLQKELLSDPSNNMFFLYDRLDSYHRTLQSGLDEYKTFIKQANKLKMKHFKPIFKELHATPTLSLKPVSQPTMIQSEIPVIVSKLEKDINPSGYFGNTKFIKKQGQTIYF